MTSKQKIMKLLGEFGPDLTLEEAVYKLDVLRRIEIAEAQLDRGEGIDHDDMVAKWRVCMKQSDEEVVVNADEAIILPRRVGASTEDPAFRQAKDDTFRENDELFRRLAK